MLKKSLLFLFLFFPLLAYSNGYNVLQLERMNESWNSLNFHIPTIFGYRPIEDNIRISGKVNLGPKIAAYELQSSSDIEKIIENETLIISIEDGSIIPLKDLIICMIGKSCTNYEKQSEENVWDIPSFNYVLDLEYFMVIPKNSYIKSNSVLLVTGLNKPIARLNLEKIKTQLPFSNGEINGKNYINKSAFDINGDNLPDIVVAETSPEYTYKYVLVNDSGKWKIAWQSSLD